ncbi:PTS transporter subunit EIIC [Spiroplasma eriocheiris]|nr:PTS transporter subunit EIIC [Spiroplasma eriocheiris]
MWGAKVAGQRHIASLRDAFISYMPFLIVGSIFIIIANFPVNSWSDILDNKYPWLGSVLIFPKRITFDMMSFWITALVAYNLCKYYKLNPIFPIISSVGFFIALTPLVGSGEASDWWKASYIPFGGYAGTSGILLAIVCSIVVTEFFKFCRDKNVRIPMPAAVPPAVTASFAALTPLFLIIIFALVLRGLFGLTEWKYLPVMLEHFLAAPISQGFIGKLGGVVLVTVLGSLGWCFGINSSAINGIVRPFWSQLLPDNQAAFAHYRQAGEYLWNNFNIGVEDFYNYVTTGGAGSTLIIICIMAVFARSEKVKTICRIAIIPGIFNINEPFLFGIPIVLNPMMWIPLILAPLASALIAYGAMHFHLAHMPIGALNPWTLPIGVLGYFTNMHWTGPILQIVTACVAGVIWFPFIKFADMDEFKKENNLDTGVLNTFKTARRLGILPPIFGSLKNDLYWEKYTQKKPYKKELANVLKEKLNQEKMHKQKFTDNVLMLDDNFKTEAQTIEANKLSWLALKEECNAEIKTAKGELRIKIKELSKEQQKDKLLVNQIKNNYKTKIRQIKDSHQGELQTLWNKYQLTKQAGKNKIKTLKKDLRKQIGTTKLSLKNNLKTVTVDFRPLIKIEHQKLKELKQEWLQVYKQLKHTAKLEISYARKTKNKELKTAQEERDHLIHEAKIAGDDIKVSKLKRNFLKQQTEINNKFEDAVVIANAKIFNQKVKPSQLKSDYYKTELENKK